MDGAPVRIGVVHAPRALGEVTAGLIAGLREAGADVDVIRAGEDLIDLTRFDQEHHLYVLKSSYGAALSLGAALHAAGARTLNPYPAVALCRDKAACCHLLAAAGLPVPETHLLAEPAAAGPLLREGPIVVKPNQGSKGQGVQVVATHEELAAIDPAGGPFVAQRYHRPEGLDRKLYRIGPMVHCVGRRWPADTYTAKVGTPLEVDGELRALVLAVGEALGIDVYGADVIVSEGRPYLVDVSAFPGFKGVPGAVRHLVDRVLAEARTAAEGEAGGG